MSKEIKEQFFNLFFVENVILRGCPKNLCLDYLTK